MAMLIGQLSGRKSLRDITDNLKATVRLRTAKTRGCVARHTILSMVYKLGQSAQKRWRRLRGFKLQADVIRGVQFKDGERVDPSKKGELNRAVV